MNRRAGKIRVLLSAYACEPGRGSEPGVGWNVARELSSRVSLRVITRANNKKAILQSGEDWVDNVEWIFWDPPKWLTFWKKGGRGVQLFYLIWQWGVKAVAQDALRNQDADVIHHVTFGKYWVPSRLAGLKRPFIFGPVGGGEETPPGLAGGFSLRSRLSDWLKKMATWFVGRFPPSVRLLNSASWTFAATPQTERALKDAGVTRVSVLPQSGIQMADFDRVKLPSEKAPFPSTELRLVSASRLIGWKAVDLAIEAVAMASTRIDVKLAVLQDGPERDALVALVDSLGASEIIEFKGKLPTLDSVYQEILGSDALIHPALHEAFGQSCVESLALGRPVICLNWGGPGIIVNDSCGYLVEPGDRDDTVKRMAEVIVEAGIEKANGLSKEESCRERAALDFSWDKIVDCMVVKYCSIIEG